MARMSRLIAAACVAGLVLAACGSSYKGLSKADFITQAQAICVSGQTKIEAISAKFTQTTSLSDIQSAYVNQLVPALKDEVKQLEALKPPKADRTTISKMLDDLSSGIDQGTESIQSAKSLQAISNLPEPSDLKAADTAANAYGLGKCSSAD